ncbi:hypothetical protein [Duganella sp. BuS-21]|uniref:hypothetical protein n=1 Tax=Duganella sp. BuS-21 TaxID=2943848 RepID=UPI0035A684C1
MAAGCSYEYLPPFDVYLPASVRLDTTWDATISRKYSCLYSSNTSTDTLTLKGKVLGQESITAAAGTFSTIKYNTTLSRVTQEFSLVTESTCWADPDSGVNIQCDSVQTYTDSKPQNNYVSTTTEELVAYSHASTQRQKLSTERYAGSWAGTFVGDDHGYCTTNKNGVNWPKRKKPSLRRLGFFIWHFDHAVFLRRAATPVRHKPANSMA